MQFGLAQNFDLKVGSPVDHLGPIGEFRRGVREARQLDGPDQTIRIAAAGRLDRRQKAERAIARSRGAGLDIQIPAELAGDEVVGVLTDLSRDMDDVARDDEGDEFGGGRERFGKALAEFGQTSMALMAFAPEAPRAGDSPVRPAFRCR